MNFGKLLNIIFNNDNPTRENNNHVIINGVTVTGNNITMDNDGNVISDGKIVGTCNDRIINVHVHSTNVDLVKTTNGDITCNDANNVETTNGDITCGEVHGNVKTTNGAVKVNKSIQGDVTTVSGDVISNNNFNNVNIV